MFFGSFLYCFRFQRKSLCAYVYGYKLKPIPFFVFKHTIFIFDTVFQSFIL